MGGGIMPRKRYNKERDCRFDDWRRNDVRKGGLEMILPLYSSDLDGVEYVIDSNHNCKPIALIEKKSTKSRWKEKLPSAMKATIELARLAGLPYYIAVHNEDRSRWIVYEASTTGQVQLFDGTLFDYVMFLCGLHSYEPPDIFVAALKRVVAIDSDGNSIESRPADT